MHQHADILDQQESLGAPFVQSLLLHAAIAGALIVFDASAFSTRAKFGDRQHQAGSAVAVNSVKTIPLPSRAGTSNPVANDTESQVPQAPEARAEKAGQSARAESHPAEEPARQEAAPAAGSAALSA